MVVGNGASPTSAGTTSLSGTSANSLASENGSRKPGGGMNPGDKSNPDPIPKFSKVDVAPIATIDGSDDPELKLDGGETSPSPASRTAPGGGAGPATPPSCTRLDEAGQACV